nr:PREDICTED: uncharacterized protein LOC109035006 [Bemisia tabaci]
MFSSKLLPGSTYMAQYFKYSPTCRSSLSQQFSSKPGHLESRLVKRGSLTENRRGQPHFPDNKGRQKRNIQNPLSSFAKRNPGIGRTLAVMKEETGTDYFDPHEDDFESSAPELETERNFFDADLDYEDLKSDEFKHRHKVAYNMVKKKYFKRPVEPNMLTYAEKQHIKFLHDDSENNWTVESLSESYPATPHIIKSIVKSKWKAKSKAEIIRHDKRVKENWEAYKKGELKIHDHLLQEHLKKFLSRNIKVPLDEEAERFLKEPEQKPRKIDEFSKIIKNYQALKPPSTSEAIPFIERKVFEELPEETRRSEFTEEHEPVSSRFEYKHKSRDSKSTNEHRSHQSTHPEGDETARGRDKSQNQTRPADENIIQETDRTNRRAKHFTLDSLRDRLEEHLKYEQHPDEMDTQIIKSRDSRSRESKVQSLDFESEQEEEEEDSLPRSFVNVKKKSTAIEPQNSADEMSYVQKVDNKLVMKTLDTDLEEELKINEYIQIPKHLRKKGALYKIEDCFYADDGQFLYRVPGLTDK